MASIQIPNLPAAVGLSGAELFEAVQSGTSVKVSLSQIIVAASGGGAVISVAQGGTGFSTYAIGDILYASASQTFSKLADVATGNAIISGGVGAAPSYGKIGLTTHVDGVLPLANGGTGQSSVLTQYGVIYGNTTSSMASTAAGTSTQLLHGNAAGAPTWGAVSLTAEVSGVLPVANGGTNISSYVVGDILYAATTTNLTTLPDVATGNALLSGGVGVAPAYGKVGLTTHVSGTLPVGNGGTNISSYTVGDILYASTSGVISPLADVATGNAIISGGVGAAPSYGKIGLTTHVDGTLPVGNGGTGQASALTQYGVVYGSSTTAMATSAAGTTTQVLHGNASGAPTFGAVSLTADVSGTLPAANGGTGVTTAPAEAARIMGYTSTATAGATTTLTNTSSQYQLFTGTLTQTITLPVTSTLTQGWTFHIVNNSTGNLTVNSSGGNLVVTVIPQTTAMVTCIGITLTTAADWEAGFTDFGSVTGTGSVVLATAPTVTTLTANGDTAFGGALKETVYALSGTTPALDPSNGTIQTWTLSASSTPTDAFLAGESMTLMIDDGTAYTITWPSVTWVNNAGAAPTLRTTGYTVVVLWKVSTTLYGALVGNGT